MHNGLFITGTNTDVGKTIVTAGILRYLRRQGHDIVPMKPVQTGATQVDGLWEAPDLNEHLRAASLSMDPAERDWMQPYCYEPACSPHLAGRMAGSYPDIDHCVACAKELGERHQGVLIEGAGGVMVPFDENESQLSLMIRLEVPALIVAHIGLGTVNHCLLTIDALRSAEVPIAGVVFNAPAAESGPEFIARDNPEIVQQFGDVDVLGNVPWLGDLEGDADRAWAAFEEHMPGLKTIQSYFTS